jgi:hypothetical protein
LVTASGIAFAYAGFTYWTDAPDASQADTEAKNVALIVAQSTGVALLAASALVTGVGVATWTLWPEPTVAE